MAANQDAYWTIEENVGFATGIPDKDVYWDVEENVGFAVVASRDVYGTVEENVIVPPGASGTLISFRR